MARCPRRRGVRHHGRWPRLHCERFAPRGAPRAAVVMIHGFSAHCGAFRQLAGTCSAAVGFAVTAFDCRGHGRSEGRHGFVRRFSDYGDDLGLVLARARASPGLPWPCRAQPGRHRDARLSLSAAGAPSTRSWRRRPTSRLKMAVPLYKRIIAPVMGALWPTLTMSNQIEPGLVARSPEACRGDGGRPAGAPRRDPALVQRGARDAGRLRASAALLKIPTFMPVAGADQLVDPAARWRSPRGRVPSSSSACTTSSSTSSTSSPRRTSVIADVVALARAVDSVARRARSVYLKSP